MMADELNVNKETMRRFSMKIYGRGVSAHSSSHTDSRTSRSYRDPHHAKSSFILVKTIPVFFIVFFSFVGNCPRRKEVSGC
jgi:hypothetical protein